MLTTWRKLLEEYRQGEGHTSSMVAYAPDAATFDKEFSTNYGLTEGEPFLAWSEDHVYFPVCYDGAEWVGSAPRNFQLQGQEHVGGG